MRAAVYVAAVVIALAALGLRLLMDPWLGAAVPYITFFGAVAISVWLGGWGPALVTAVLGYLLPALKYGQLHDALGLSEAALLHLALYALSCAFIIGLGEGMRRARDRFGASETALRERAAQLQRADANRSHFLAVLSHELRNPLAPLRTGIALLRLNPDAASVHKTHDMMERQVRQLTRLIDDLLDVSRIDRGKLELRRERVSLESAVRAGVETAMPVIEAKSHELVARYAQGLYVQGDAMRLAQVVANLLNNAAKYTPPAGRIELSVGAEDGRAVVSVADNGIGIAAEHLSAVFDMFVQIEPSHTAGSGGLGLGLTLVRSIVQAHQGEIEARSAGPGQGSQFTVRLPLVAAPATLAASNLARAPTAGGRRVLVVDDNADAARSLAQLLELQGHRVQEVRDGHAALQIAEALRPEIAFIDLNMPGIDGLEVARRLRATLWGHAVTLVALTGMGQQADIARTKAAGFDLHLTKPADPSRVAALASRAGQHANVLPIRGTGRGA